MAIRTWASEETRGVFDDESPDVVPRNVLKRATAKLLMVNVPRALQDLTVLPGNRMEQLRGNREGQHSIRINDQYRVCFVWRDGDAYDVEITDYH